MKNEQFSNENAASMVWSDTITFQLLTRGYFGTFTSKPIADAHKASAMLIALPRDSREEVDAMIKAAAAAVGKADIRERQDMGFMYVRTFEDPEGHIFEPMWMDVELLSPRRAISTTGRSDGTEREEKNRDGRPACRSSQYSRRSRHFEVPDAPGPITSEILLTRLLQC